MGTKINRFIDEFTRDIIKWQKSIFEEKNRNISKLGFGKSLNKKIFLNASQNNNLHIRNEGRSIYLNKISPSCIHCSEGSGLTIELSKKCNRNCFFCFNKKSLRKSFRNTNLFSKKKLIEANSNYFFESFAISGGEPLLHYEKVIKCIKIVKQITKGKTIVRIYTNGDLITANKLKNLKAAGLDEIRIGLKPGAIKLKPLKLASNYIKRVLVEMPVLPDKRGEMENLIVELDKMNIFGINLLEFLYCGHNAYMYKRKKYYIKPKWENNFFDVLDADGNCYPVAKSEETCLYLLRYALDKKIKIGVHYCSFENKRLGYINCRFHNAQKLKLQYHDINKDGLLESLIIFEPQWLNAYVELKRNGVIDSQIAVSSRKTYILTHPENKKLLDHKKYTMGLVQILPYGGIVNFKLLKH